MQFTIFLKPIPFHFKEKKEKQKIVKKKQQRKHIKSIYEPYEEWKT